MNLTVTITKRKIITILFIIYLGVVIFFPLDQFYIKIMVLGIAGLLTAKSFIEKNDQPTFLAKMICFIFPFCTIAMSFILTGNIVSSFRAGYVPILFLWLPIIIYQDIDLIKYLMMLLKIEAVIIVLLGLLDFCGFIDVNNGGIRDFIYHWEIGIMGKSVAYPFYYKIFFKTSPLIVFLLEYAFRKKQYVTVCISCIALTLSGTRANFIIMFILLIWCFVKNFKTLYLRLFFLLLILVIIFTNLSNIITGIDNIMNFAGSITSDQIRNRQFDSYLLIFSNPINLLFGTGFGSSFYNLGRNAFAVTAELAYFDLLRQIGLIFFIPFLLFILFPFYVLRDNTIKVSYLGYLLISFTNPLLFSSTGFLVYLYMYYICFTHSRKISK